MLNYANAIGTNEMNVDKEFILTTQPKWLKVEKTGSKLCGIIGKCMHEYQLFNSINEWQIVRFWWTESNVEWAHLKWTGYIKVNRRIWTGCIKVNR